MSPKLPLALALALAGLLAACGSSNDDELHQWMAEQRAAIKPQVKPIPEPKKFTPENYTEEGKVEPFDMQKMTQALKRDSQQAGTASAALLEPELTREIGLITRNAPVMPPLVSAMWESAQRLDLQNRFDALLQHA